MPSKQLLATASLDAETQKKRAAELKARKAKRLRRKKTFDKRIAGLSKLLTNFRSPYVVMSLLVLLITSLFWSLLGARLQQTNADEVVEGSLFKNLTVFHGALFPNAHSFLIKWPLFMIAGLFNNSATIITTLTVIVSLITVGGLVYILYRIDKRPRVFGTLVLALSSVLLFIPAQPYAGGLLPVNFAMLATRNIEYLFYILALVCVIRSKKLKSRMFVYSLIVFGLLFASDKLFESLALGSAVITLITYIILRRSALAFLAIRLLISAGVATLLATILLAFINLIHLTHIVGGASTPYSFITTAKELGLGLSFALLGLLTNLGANPAYDIGMLKSIPSTVIGRLIGPVGVPYVVNFLVFILGVISAIKVVLLSVVKPKKPRWNAVKIPPAYSQSTTLSILLIASSLTAIGTFVLSNHYYPVDSRYLSIILFAVFISIATYLRSIPVPKWVGSWGLGVVLLVGIAVGCVWTFTTNQQQQTALSTITSRNQKVADVLENHKTDLLVGDYWRVVPISELDQDKSDSILPLQDCTTPRAVLNSTAWQSDLTHHSFTYLLSLDKGLTDYPQCSISQIVNFYGHPNASTLIAGTNDHPQELLLFYDGGITKGILHPKGGKYATILPNTAKQVVPTPICADNTTIMNIVAHQDDDLLFMNPDLSHEISAGQCIRTVYVTAGDAGQGSVYWLGREQGSEAAYDSLLNIPSTTVWIQKTIKLAADEFVTVANPYKNKAISLIFMRLADGNLTGRGFAASGFESIAKLHYGSIPTIDSVDGQSSYTSDQLTAALTALMTAYQPTIIHTQAPRDYGTIYHDHSDHITVGRYVQSALPGYANQANTPVSYYVGYPIRQRPANVSGTDLDIKTDAFLAYAQHDPGVCQSLTDCDDTPTYNAYLTREYTTDQY
jgi:LmbE family N-acetylglucosaminyl deacetylase